MKAWGHTYNILQKGVEYNIGWLFFPKAKIIIKLQLSKDELYT